MTNLTDQKATEAVAAEELTPVHAERSQKFFDITGKSLEELAEKVQECLQDLSDETNLNMAIQIRSQLVTKFKPINDLIETVETKIKAKDLSAGEYGFLSRLVISYAKKTTVNEPLVFQQLKKMKLDPLNYAKLDTSNAVVKDIISKNPGMAEVDLYGTKRHSFK